MILRGLMSVPESPGKDVLSELIAVCDRDEVARLTVLRGIRDALESDSNWGDGR